MYTQVWNMFVCKFIDLAMYLNIVIPMSEYQEKTKSATDFWHLTNFKTTR